VVSWSTTRCSSMTTRSLLLSLFPVPINSANGFDVGVAVLDISIWATMLANSLCSRVARQSAYYYFTSPVTPSRCLFPKCHTGGLLCRDKYGHSLKS
jgi:hypothetical protein